VSAEVGSNEDMDILSEDVLQDKDNRATGYVGKASELQWLRWLRHGVERLDEAPEGPYGPPGNSPKASTQRLQTLEARQRRDTPGDPVPTSTSSFYLDNEDIEIDFSVDPYELPPIQTAKRLFDSYMSTVQDTFPILPRTAFTEQFNAYFTYIGQGAPYAVPDKWLATVNLVFAIGAKYSHLVEADWRASDQDHLMYQSRALMLGLNGSSLISLPDIMQVHVAGLYAFYLLAVGRVNR
jgi:hypothetical protein